VSDPQGTGTGNNDAGNVVDNADGTKPDATGGGAPTNGGAPADDKSTNKPAEGAADPVYEFEAPDGIELDTKSVDEFKAIAKELKLPPESAKKIAGIAIAAEAKRAEAFKAEVARWADVVGKDAELSKPDVQAAARTAIETFGTPELKALLNSTGMGNHPELVRFVAKVGQAMSEDKVLGKGTGDKSTKTPAEVLYGSK